jgi:hypothetical protein
MDHESDYNIGVRLRRSLAQAIREKSHVEYRSFNGTLNMLLAQALKKPVMENLVEEVQKNTREIEILTAAVQSLTKQIAENMIGGKKK